MTGGSLMRKTFSVVTVLAVSCVGVLGVVMLRSAPVSAQQDPGVSGQAAALMAQITAIKQGFTPAQQKIDSNLVFAAKASTGELAGTGIDTVPSVAQTAAQAAQDGYVTVDINGNVSQAVLDAISGAGGVVNSQSGQWGMIRAALPLGAVDTVAAQPDVLNIQVAAESVTNIGSLTSQGYISHTANQVVNQGINGSGVTVGVLSDSCSSTRMAALVGTGDLPPDVSVLPGQAGSGSDEGCAMMEIVHDIAPGAHLIFATAFNGPAGFANNILGLQTAGASVIVDDVTYFNEGAFQDGPIARAVNQATANGAIYFSSAANSGNLTSWRTARPAGQLRARGRSTTSGPSDRRRTTTR
jgi:hypothetical protein